jgi:hypothetical protein
MLDLAIIGHAERLISLRRPKRSFLDTNFFLRKFDLRKRPKEKNVEGSTRHPTSHEGLTETFWISPHSLFSLQSFNITAWSLSLPIAMGWKKSTQKFCRLSTIRPKSKRRSKLKIHTTSRTTSRAENCCNLQAERRCTQEHNRSSYGLRLINPSTLCGPPHSIRPHSQHEWDLRNIRSDKQRKMNLATTNMFNKTHSN